MNIKSLIFICVFYLTLICNNEIHVQCNAEIRTSLDFGQLKIVRFKFVPISDKVWNPNNFVWISDVFFCLKTKLWYRTESFFFGSIHKRSNRTIEKTEQPKCLKSERLETEHKKVWISALFGFRTFGFQHSTVIVIYYFKM